MPSVAAIEDKDTAREFAEFIASPDYTNRQQACDKFGISKKTVTKWSKDPRVTIHLRELKAEREERLSRRIDGELLRRIDDPVILKELDVKTLLDLRKQVLGPASAQKEDDDVDDADMTALLEDNPDVAEALITALSARTEKLPDAAE